MFEKDLWPMICLLWREKDWNINEEHTLTDKQSVNPVIPLPILLPVVQNDFKMVELLIKNKARLDYKKAHIMTYALEYIRWKI